MKSKNSTVRLIDHFPFLFTRIPLFFFATYFSFNLYLHTWRVIPLPTDPKRYSSW